MRRERECGERGSRSDSGALGRVLIVCVCGEVCVVPYFNYARSVYPGRFGDHRGISFVVCPEKPNFLPPLLAFRKAFTPRVNPPIVANSLSTVEVEKLQSSLLRILSTGPFLPFPRPFLVRTNFVPPDLSCRCIQVTRIYCRRRRRPHRLSAATRMKMWQRVADCSCRRIRTSSKNASAKASVASPCGW